MPERAPDDAPSEGSGEPADDGPQLLAFVVGDRSFGCPLADVREVISTRPTTRLPGAPPHVLGLLNLRGTLLTVLDLGLALGARQEPAPAAPNSRDGDGALPAPCTVVREYGSTPPHSPHSRTPALPASSAAVGHVLVVEIDGRRVGCRVDAVRRVHPMPSLVSPPQVGNVMPPGIVLGMGDAGDTMVAVLDLPALVRQTLLFPGER